MKILTSNIHHALSFLGIDKQPLAQNHYSMQAPSSFSGFLTDDTDSSIPTSIYETEGKYEGWSNIIYEHFAQSSQMPRLSKCTGHEPILAVAQNGKGFYGQHDHTWITGDGNLYISIYFPAAWLKNHLKITRLYIHDNVQNQSLLSLIQRLPCIAVYHALQELFHPNGLSIKPPNDIVIIDDQKMYKLAGCLAEVSMSGDDIMSARIGIGLNVNYSPKIPQNLGLPAISCKELAAGHNPVACSIVLKKICSALQVWT